MTLRKRSLILAVVLMLLMAVYGMARYYSEGLIHYVVEHAFLMRASDSMDVNRLRKDFRAHVALFPPGKARLQRLLEISHYLEKFQKLKESDLEHYLLRPPAVSPPAGP